MSTPEPDWRQAACRGKDPELFFPIAGSADEQDARNICHTCTIKNECLDWALAQTGHQAPDGIWGATSTEDRDRIRRGKLRKRCPICYNQHLHMAGTDQMCGACGMSWPAVRGAPNPNTDVAPLR